jgi:2',3'-cyclic-nucleotide 2'-phosphodiesterase / 3'-nucleotidase
MHFRSLLLAMLAAAMAFAAEVKIRVLATTDLHGHILPFDYFTAQPAERGLAKVATLIAKERAGNPFTLLVDCGDTIQGSPLAATYQNITIRSAQPPPDPMMAAMNALRYDAMALGNHEFNYGLRNLENARQHASFPWLSANTQTVPGSAARPFLPYIVKTLGEVKVGIIGITTPSIPNWEIPANYKGYRFLPGEDAARTAVAELKALHSPDLILVIAHSGLDRDLKTGRIFPNAVPGENMAYQLAQIPGVDALIFGHTHRSLPGESVGSTVLLQPLNWGGSLGRLDITLSGAPGHWRIRHKESSLIPVTNDVPADPKILAIAQPYHEAAERELNTPVAGADADMDTSLARQVDTPLIDAIHEVQLHYAKADVSFASAFNTNLRVKKGPVTVRQLAALYVYDNELYAIEGTGRMVKDALENSARYFQPDGKPNPAVMGFNFDMAQGVTYEIDPAQPEGSRITNLRWNGRPLSPDQRLRIAVNNYRYAGSAGYQMFRDAKIIWQSHRPVRDLMVEYFTAKKRLPSAPDNNWRLKQ